MSSLFVVIISLTLTVIEIMLKSFHIVHNQPGYSLDDDPVNKLAAERRANYHFFQLQRERLLRRQKRVGRYAWLVLAAFIATSGWLYAVAVKVTTVSKQISAIQTLAVSGSQETVLSLTLSDGSHVQYVIKAPAARQINVAGKKEGAKKSVQKWELASLATAFNVGDASLPFGIALNMAN